MKDTTGIYSAEGEYAGRPLPAKLAIRLALRLTRPRCRTTEFSRLGGNRHTDNPADMVGLAVGTALEFLSEHTIVIPTKKFLADTFGGGGGYMGDFLKGELRPVGSDTIKTWILRGQDILRYLFLGMYHANIVKERQRTQPDGLANEVWQAWRRVDQVLFRELDAEGIPRFFRGRRRACPGCWSVSELISELEGLGLYSTWLGGDCTLVMVSGGCQFPQTDQNYRVSGPWEGSSTIGDATRNILEQGVNVRFIIPDDANCSPAKSYREFELTVPGDLVRTKRIRSIYRPVKSLSFLTPAIQFMYILAGPRDNSDETLYIIRGLQPTSTGEDREAITALATDNELEAFRKWLSREVPAEQWTAPTDYNLRLERKDKHGTGSQESQQA